MQFHSVMIQKIAPRVDWETDIRRLPSIKACLLAVASSGGTSPQ